MRVDVTHDMELENFPEVEDLRELSKEKSEEQKTQIASLAHRFKERFSFDFTDQRTFCGNLQIANFLSGAKINYSLGKGLFNFCYADFNFLEGEKKFLDVVNKIQKLFPDNLNPTYEVCEI